MDLGLEGSAAVVTGGTKGMGRAIAETFADDGARVAVLARGSEGIDDTVAELQRRGSPDAFGISVDLTDTLHNHWMETLDYVHHQATLNCHSTQLEPDGSARWVIAHHDPGVRNWLDTAGHRRGTVGVRWVGPDVVDVLPTTRVVKLSSL